MSTDPTPFEQHAHETHRTHHDHAREPSPEVLPHADDHQRPRARRAGCGEHDEAMSYPVVVPETVSK